jgi:hypothetical protein
MQEEECLGEKCGFGLTPPRDWQDRLPGSIDPTRRGSALSERTEINLTYPDAHMKRSCCDHEMGDRVWRLSIAGQ